MPASKTATLPPESAPSTRNRIVVAPTWMSSPGKRRTIARGRTCGHGRGRTLGPVGVHVGRIGPRGSGRDANQRVAVVLAHPDDPLAHRDSHGLARHGDRVADALARRRVEPQDVARAAVRDPNEPEAERDAERLM